MTKKDNKENAMDKKISAKFALKKKTKSAGTRCPFKSPTDSFMSPVTKALLGRNKTRRRSSNNLLKAASKKAHLRFLAAQAKLEKKKEPTETTVDEKKTSAEK